MPYDSLPLLSPSLLAGERASLAKRLLRPRHQLAGAILMCVVLPFLLRFGYTGVGKLDAQLGTSILVLFAVLFSHLMIGKMSRYPGQSSLATTIPAVCLAFGVVVLLVMLTQFSYSRYILGGGFLMCLAWYGATGLIRMRASPPRLVLAPLGNGNQLSTLPGASWARISHPVSVELLHGTDGLVVDLSAELNDEWNEFLVTCGKEGIAIYDSTRTREQLTGQVALTHAGDIGLDTLLPQRGYLTVKGAIDTILALMSLPIVLPIIAAAAIAIRLDSPGAALFVQKRVGFRGRVFNCYKLRSMHVEAEQSGPTFTSDQDPRITRVGRVIRKYRIDELPQVFNILKGEMSWIGPRPEAVALAEHYGRSIPFYALRHAVKPGLSGWAAIRQGNVAEVEAAATKLQYDFFYIKNISPTLDVFIAAKTAWIVLTGLGSK
jgi:lipopolysaccharide/colanic/teichoic acid biosynthesis glycosyltransferase